MFFRDTKSLLMVKPPCVAGLSQSRRLSLGQPTTTQRLFFPNILPEPVVADFDQRRETRAGFSPIPETLWTLAVAMAREHGVNQAAQ